jgi:RNA polymerase sigma factor (sigma-70 family)
MDELIDKISVEYRKGKISEPDYKKFVDILQARSPLNFTHIPLDVINADNQDHRDDHTDRRLGIDIIKHLQQVDTVDKILARKSTVLRILEILDAEELRLIKLYHGLETGREHTYKEIAEIFKCSKQKAHQWHQRIIKKLRTRLKEICQDDGIDQKELICDN